jgi:hypothetical protein
MLSIKMPIMIAMSNPLLHFLFVCLFAGGDGASSQLDDVTVIGSSFCK